MAISHWMEHSSQTDETKRPCGLQMKILSTHTEKIRNTTRGSRLWEVKNSGFENSYPTEVKRTFIHQNLSIFITKSMRNFCQTKSSPQNQRTYI
jgi:hypothetical protein